MTLLELGGFLLTGLRDLQAAVAGRRLPSFLIDVPEGNASSLEWVSIHGSGAPVGSQILLFTYLVGGPCWLQPDAVEADSHGDWVHPRCNLHSRRERYVYALAVRPKDVEAVKSLPFSSTNTVAELERLLGKAGVKYKLSKRKRLARSHPDGAARDRL